MAKTLAGLLGVAGVLAVPAHASNAVPRTMEAAMQASSYSDLLKPIPNALALLKESQAVDAEPASEHESVVQEVQFWLHHHHHHHHHYRRRYHHHHHHHHHHQSKV